MGALQDLATWLHSTRLSWAVAGGYPWIWPLCETLHFMGLALLVGIVGVLDLRLLGVGRALPIAPLQRLIPAAIAGFAVNLVTGALFFSGDPGQYIHNPAFWYKMLFIALAGVNVLLFYVTGLSRQVDDLRAGDRAPAGARAVAAISLFLWVGVMYWGRMLPFIGNAF